MVVRQRGDRTQIAVLEDGVLVEHYVDKASHQSYVGNVYLGKVQNVLPSMEAAFVDIGKGRNAVLYAGEVNFDASGLEGESKRIESALKSGQSILVQVTKDPIGHKGARLTSQVSLPGRYLVYVPGASHDRHQPQAARHRADPAQADPQAGHARGRGRDRADRRRGRVRGGARPRRGPAGRAVGGHRAQGQDGHRARAALQRARPDHPGGPGHLQRGLQQAGRRQRRRVGHGRRVRPLRRAAPGRPAGALEPDDQDVFAAYRIDEQLAKALERKVWLPSGGSLVIDRTEAMTVVDVNTGKFTGQGGNLEQTVTRNNLEAAEEIVRQLRLRDVGGIIVIDFIDMVLESNRELVLRRLLECLARDRTKHQVAEVTSLGLVQMTRKRVGSGLLEAFSEPCEHCNGRGVHRVTGPGRHRAAGSDSSGNSGQSNGTAAAAAGRVQVGRHAAPAATARAAVLRTAGTSGGACERRAATATAVPTARTASPARAAAAATAAGATARTRCPAAAALSGTLGPGGRLGHWRRGHRRPGNDGCPRDRGHRRPDRAGPRRRQLGRPRSRPADRQAARPPAAAEASPAAGAPAAAASAGPVRRRSPLHARPPRCPPRLRARSGPISAPRPRRPRRARPVGADRTWTATEVPAPGADAGHPPTPSQRPKGTETARQLTA